MKRYGDLFWCLTTIRGVHLEFSTDMTTDAFTLAHYRFIARYGHVKILRSDNCSRKRERAERRTNLHIPNQSSTKFEEATYSIKIQPSVSSVDERDLENFS